MTETGNSRVDEPGKRRGDEEARAPTITCIANVAFFDPDQPYSYTDTLAEFDKLFEIKLDGFSTAIIVEEVSECKEVIPKRASYSRLTPFLPPIIPVRHDISRGCADLNVVSNIPNTVVPGIQVKASGCLNCESQSLITLIAFASELYNALAYLRILHGHSAFRIVAREAGLSDDETATLHDVIRKLGALEKRREEHGIPVSLDELGFALQDLKIACETLCTHRTILLAPQYGMEERRVKGGIGAVKAFVKLCEDIAKAAKGAPGCEGAIKLYILSNEQIRETSKLILRALERESKFLGELVELKKGKGAGGNKGTEESEAVIIVLGDYSKRDLRTMIDGMLKQNVIHLAQVGTGSHVVTLRPRSIVVLVEACYVPSHGAVQYCIRAGYNFKCYDGWARELKSISFLQHRENLAKLIQETLNITQDEQDLVLRILAFILRSTILSVST